MVYPTNRRRFLMGFGGLTAACALPQLPRTLRAQSDSGGTLQRFYREGVALGSAISLTVYHEHESAAREAIDAALQELALIEQLMSIYRDDSQISKLNRNGELKSPHPYLIEILTVAQYISEQTAGAFDVTVQPLWRLYADANRRGVSLQREDIERVQRRVNYRQIRVETVCITLANVGVEITLNGIAQGFALDKVKAVLAARGVTHALLDLGELGAIGDKPGAEKWKTGIQHPRDRDAYISVAQLDNRCLATSGDYATTFSDDFKKHHIIDPKTGESPLELASVTIAAPTAVLADALSTAFFVLGSSAGEQLISQFPHTDACIVGKDGRMSMTSHFPTA